MAGERITYCVLDVDGGSMLERCVDSIRRQSAPGKIILVDNGSAKPVSERIPDVQVIRFEENRGFAAGANAAIRAATTPFVALVNNDAMLDPGWAETLLAAFQSPGVAAAQSVVLRPDGRVDSAGIEVRGGRFVQIGYGRELKELAFEREPWGVAGAAFVLRRDVFIDDVFSEPLFAWYEDVDLAARLRDGGWSVHLHPEPLVTHQGSASSTLLPHRGEVLRVRNRYLVARSRELGNAGSLLLEDLRRAARAILTGEPGSAARIVRGIAAGLSSRKLPALRVRSAPE